MTPRHFATAAGFRAWLERHHARATELSVAFYKKSSGRPGMTYQEAVEEALCFGWIDGIIRRIDEHSYCHRFTPRRPGSHWSLVNIRHVARLKADGRMHAAGLAAYAARRPDRTGTASYEQRPRDWPAELRRRFKTHRAAWKFWQAQPPGYRRLTIWWVTSAKQPATRERRLARLIAQSADGRRLT